MLRQLRKLKNQKGAEMVEIALILGLISVVSIGVVTTIGQNANAQFTTVNGALQAG